MDVTALVSPCYRTHSFQARDCSRQAFCGNRRWPRRTWYVYVYVYPRVDLISDFLDFWLPIVLVVSGSNLDEFDCIVVFLVVMFL